MIRGLHSLSISVGLAGVALVGYSLIRNERALLRRKAELEVQLSARRILGY